MRKVKLPRFLTVTLGIALIGIVNVGCGSGGDKSPSPEQAKADAQQQIDAINKRTDMPAAAKEQVIGHIQQSLRHELAPPKEVPGRKVATG
jgi:hypothetical protein